MQICSHFQPVVLKKWRQWQNCEETERQNSDICTLEGSCNQRTVMKEEPPELFSRSESKMPTGSWSVRHHHIFNSSSAFLKSFQPCLYTFIVKQGQVIRKCMHRKKWRPAKKGIGRPITRCHCDFCNLWKRANHGEHRFPILKGQKQTD